MPLSNLSGQRFGKLFVESYSHSDNHRVSYWACVCDCGNKVAVRGGHLKIGKTKSCGCLRPRHGLCSHRLYKTWESMIGRCKYESNPSYDNYGGRGITVCDRWLSVIKFIEDMGSTYKEGLWLDRIDNNGHYEPRNCRWTTPSQNLRNRKR